MVAHDLYHHCAGDTGSLVDELASLGAEHYISFENSQPFPGGEHSTPPGLSSIQRSAASIVGMAWEALASPRKFKLEACRHEPGYPCLNHFFIEAEKSAVYELRFLSGEPESSRDPWFSALKKFATPGVIASWVNKGYHDARTRFPDQLAVRACFNQLLDQLDNLHRTMDEDLKIQVSLEGCQAKLAVLSNSKSRLRPVKLI